jgi:hypothetical protein
MYFKSKHINGRAGVTTYGSMCQPLPCLAPHNNRNAQTKKLHPIYGAILSTAIRPLLVQTNNTCTSVKTIQKCTTTSSKYKNIGRRGVVDVETQNQTTLCFAVMRTYHISLFQQDRHLSTYAHDTSPRFVYNTTHKWASFCTQAPEQPIVGSQGCLNANITFSCNGWVHVVCEIPALLEAGVYVWMVGRSSRISETESVTALGALCLRQCARICGSPRGELLGFRMAHSSRPTQST